MISAPSALPSCIHSLIYPLRQMTVLEIGIMALVSNSVTFLHVVYGWFSVSFCSCLYLHEQDIWTKSLPFISPFSIYEQPKQVRVGVWVQVIYYSYLGCSYIEKAPIYLPQNTYIEKINIITGMTFYPPYSAWWCLVRMSPHAPNRVGVTSEPFQNTVGPCVG